MVELKPEQAAAQALIKISRLFERSLSEISLADFRVLSAVGQGEERASRLALLLVLGKPSISSSVESLIRRGLLTRTSHEGDLRAFTLALTLAGEEARVNAQGHISGILHALLAEVKDPENSMAVLAELWDALERVPALRGITHTKHAVKSSAGSEK